MAFYAYVHARPDTLDSSGVFYVGKGRKHRYRPLPARNRHHRFVLEKHGVENILIGRLECSAPELASELEIGIIKCLRRVGVKLTNMTDGGDGPNGFVMPEEARAKIAAASRRLAQNPEVQAKRSAASSAAVALAWASPEGREKKLIGLRGKKKTLTAAAIEARRANSEKARSPEAIAKKSAAAKARWADPEWRANMLAARRMANEKKVMIVSEGHVSSFLEG